MVTVLVSACAAPKSDNVVVLKKSGLPVVYYRVMISAGAAMDPADKPGLACFTANLLQKGTISFTRDQIEAGLDQIGGEIGISVDKEVVVITGRTLAENSGKFYAIFREILTAPTFSEDQARLLQSEQIDQIKQIREDDRSLAAKVLENRLFAGHRYGHLTEGAESSVKSFTRDDAVKFYRDNYTVGNILAGIGGAVEDTLVDRLQSDLAKMPSGKVVRSSVMPQLPKQRQVVLIEKENRAQSQLRIGHVVDYNRTNPDYFPMRLLGCYLGEHRESFGRLFKTVRSDRGLAYGAYAYTEYFQQAGWSKLIGNGIPRTDQYFSMWTYPKEINFEFCIKLMLTEMTNLTTTPISGEDYDRVKAYAANQYAFLMETPDKQLGMRLDEKWYKTPGFVDKYQESINKVPRSSLQSVALDHLHPDQVLIVAMVSNGEAAKKALLASETKLELPSGAQEGDLEALNKEIKAFNLGLKPEDIVIVKASEMFK
jgi:zinc protease